MHGMYEVAALVHMTERIHYINKLVCVLYPSTVLGEKVLHIKLVEADSTECILSRPGHIPNCISLNVQYIECPHSTGVHHTLMHMKCYWPINLNQSG